MAVAGRVAIRPRGAFDIGASYKRLDLVKYQNTLFLAKKAVSGVLPAEGEYWMDCGGTDLSDIEKKLAKLEVPEFTEAEELEALEPKKQAGTLWGRVAKAVSSLIAHLGNKNNPHKVTASQTGAMTKGDILNSTVATEAGQAAADAVQLNKEVEGSYAAGVAEEISGINADLAKLNGFSVYNSFESLGISEENASYMDFVEKMPYNSILLCSCISDFMPTPYPSGYLLTVTCHHSRDDKFITFQAICGSGSTDDVYTARYAGWSKTPWSGWRKSLSASDFSSIPCLYNFFLAKQPLFLISENSQDTMYCNDRGCRRNSSAKALIFKKGTSLKGVSKTSGYCIISYSAEDAGCTALTNYGGVSISNQRTPKGNNVSLGIMDYAWVSTGGTVDFPVVAMINGEEHTLESRAIYTSDAESYAFILSMADLYL